jgi:hypothetical protein
MKNVVIEYKDWQSHTTLSRDRESKIVPPKGALVRLLNDRVYEVTGHMFDYQTNAPDLWVCVMIKPRPQLSL